MIVKLNNFVTDSLSLVEIKINQQVIHHSGTHLEKMSQMYKKCD